MSWENYDDALSQLRDAGLLVDRIEVNTHRPVRCLTEGGGKDKRGWYWISDLYIENRSYLVGAFGVYHGMDNGKQSIRLNKTAGDALTAEQRDAIKARQKEAHARAEAERRRSAEQAARRAASVWEKALVAPLDNADPDYLTRKAIAAYGLRYTESGALIVPMQDATGKVHGLQFILPSHHPRRKKTGRDKEYWPAGMAKQGHWFQIGSPATAGICLVTEGYATAATLHAATGLPVAVAFDANNLGPVAAAVREASRARILVCADDDYLQKCRACNCLTQVDNPQCAACGEPHGQSNPGVTIAQAAAMAVNGAWIAPEFPASRDGKKLTDFNDLQQFPGGGLALVRVRIETKLRELGWRAGVMSARTETAGGAGNERLKAVISVEEAIARFTLVYSGEGGVLFDSQERMLATRAAAQDLLPEHGWRDLRRHPDWITKPAVRMREVGFDPTGKDPAILCNLWGGWPTTPRAGSCERLLELLEYLCNGEGNGREIYQWVLRWLAYPIQHPGAKLKTALIFHGPQGVGKNLFFETVAAIYGEYARVIDQAAVEDKFNDWASKKLLMIADEVVARAELYHLKNKLKCFITGETIRINPKNVAAHEERNHVNLIFLSNESQPLALEDDDRRYAVVKTPPKLPPALYSEVKAEIDAGGIAALHHYLLHLDLGDFAPWSMPPMTRAKRELIELSMGSTDRFSADWRDGVLGVGIRPCLVHDVYRLYRWWCNKEGERFPLAANRLTSALQKCLGGISKSDNIRVGMKRAKPRIFFPAGVEAPPGEPKERWLTHQIETFSDEISTVIND